MLLVLPGELVEVIFLDDVARLTVNDGDDEVGVRDGIGLGDGDLFLAAVTAVHRFLIFVHVRLDIEINDHYRNPEIVVQRGDVIEEIDVF